MTNLTAFQYALRLLQGKPYGSDNLKYKLLLKGFEEDEVKGALLELFEYGYLDDRVYAASYVENLINYKTFGYYGIKSKLKQKMLPNDLIEEVLLKVTPSVEEELAIKYCQLNKKKNKQALIGALSRRGFRSEAIYKILNNEDLKLQI